MKLEAGSVRLHIFSSGHCRHLEAAVLRGGSWWPPVRLPCMFAVIDHPRIGICLFDTGLCEHLTHASSTLPGALYPLVAGHVPPAEGQDAKAHLSRLGFSAADVTLVFISHFHGDHVAGLRDFPNAQFVHAAEAYDKMGSLRGVRATCQGVVPGCLPADFEQRSARITSSTPTVSLAGRFRPMEVGWDVAGNILAMYGQRCSRRHKWISDVAPGCRLWQAMP